MLTYTPYTVSEYAPDAPGTADHFRRWFQNWEAGAEGAANAPIIQHGWHPYNGVLNGDANSGLFYDFAVSGAVASVETPAFADGYEYLIVLESYAKAGAGAVLQIEPYRDQSAAYGGAMSLGVSPSTGAVSGFIEIKFPRRTMRCHFMAAMVAIDIANGSTGVWTTGTTNHTTATKIGKARLSWVGAINNTGGKLYLYKRRLP